MILADHVDLYVCSSVLMSYLIQHGEYDLHITVSINKKFVTNYRVWYQMKGLNPLNLQIAKIYN